MGLLAETIVCFLCWPPTTPILIGYDAIEALAVGSSNLWRSRRINRRTYSCREHP